MTLGLDYDNTFTADRDLWLAFITAAQARGHVVVCVTNRCGPDEENTGTDGPIDEALPIEVIYCNNSPKRTRALEAGFAVDVWIDDKPSLVDHGNWSYLAAAGSGGFRP